MRHRIKRSGAGTCTDSLNGAESCTLDVAFAPKASGPHGATARVTSTPGGAFDVPVSGIGTAPAALTLQALEGTNFGAVGVTASSTRSLTLSNTGDLPVGTFGITLGPGFSLAPRAGNECLPNFTPLDGGTSCGFRVVFQPNTIGNFVTRPAPSPCSSRLSSQASARRPSRSHRATSASR